MADPIQIVDRLLHDIAKEQNLVNYDLKIEPITSGGANYTSSLFNASITEGENTIYLFAKVAAFGDKLRDKSPKYFETESFVFTKLLKVYERLQDEHEVPTEHRLSYPKFYGCNPATYEETVVLEDLVKGGYQAFDRFTTYDWEYAKAAITELGKFHALALAYSEYHPEEYNKIVDNLSFEWDTETAEVEAFSRKMITNTIVATREETRDKVISFFTSLDKEMIINITKPLKRPVLGHGDFRPSNLMHRDRGDGTVDIKIVDLQTMQGNSPVVDLLYFIFTGSDEQFREQYYEKLLDHYYTQLSAAMIRLHLDPEKVYSRQDFEYELKEKLPYGLTIAVFTLPIVTVEVNNAPKVDENMELTALSVDNTSQLYKERLNGIVNDYVKWGILK